MKCSKIMTHKLSPRFHHHIKAVIITTFESLKFSDNALRHQLIFRRELPLLNLRRYQHFRPDDPRSVESHPFEAIL